MKNINPATTGIDSRVLAMSFAGPTSEAVHLK